MKKVFIHLGLPKTGSTYLQHIFAKNSALYNQHGLIYKDFSNNFSAVNKNRPTNGNAGKIANSLIGNFSLINKSNNPTKVKQDIQSGVTKMLFVAPESLTKKENIDKKNEKLIND